jgi:hypothetical protein
MVLASPVGTAAKPLAGLKQADCDFWDKNQLPTSVVFGTGTL